MTRVRNPYGALNVLVTRMNPDLAMGDELLNKTGTRDLFMVFGEPDIVIGPAPPGDGYPQVELQGLRSVEDILVNRRNLRMGYVFA